MSNKDKIPTPEEFVICVKHDDLFTKEELDKDWYGVPITVDEVTSYMKDYAKLIVQYTLEEVNKTQKLKFNAGETGYLDTEARYILEEEIIKQLGL